MNVCLVHEEYPEETNFGGIATYEKTIAEEYVKQGHKVYVICRGLTKDKEYVENGVNVTRIFVEEMNNQIDYYIRYRERVAEELDKLQNSNKIDIIEVPDWGAETILFEKRRRIPLVVRLHTPLKIWLDFNKNDFGAVKDLMLEWENKMISSADLVTCCSSALKRLIQEKFDVSKDNIYVTPNPANLNDFYRDDSIEKEDSLIFVGSLEERKGVLLLARALNIVFEKYPDLKIKLIGKDTNRNEKNISTKQFVYDIVDDRFKDNIEFLGQLPNIELNPYLNKAKVGIFPSLFDNFPYVVLEAMATGLHVVGSSNSGMVEMLDDESSIYNTGNLQSLAEKIIEKYELSNIQKISARNMMRVNKLYAPKPVCKNMMEMYEQTIRKYYIDVIKKEDLNKVLHYIDNSIDVKYYSREFGGVANFVFKVITNKNVYIVKKYFYDYDFMLSNELYDIYIKNGINVIKPLNDSPIEIDGYYYNVYTYKKKDELHNNIEIEYYNHLICIDRRTDRKANLLEKCMFYYCELKKTINLKKEYLHVKYIKEVIDIFEKLKDDAIFYEQYINHGDISNGNIIFSNGQKFLIDFDEANVTTLLYDFAVIVVKQFVNNNSIDMEKYNKLKNLVKQKYTKYLDDDFVKVLEFYLCKILLEKFYLHQIGKINLYDERQMLDNYEQYIQILRHFEQ